MNRRFMILAVGMWLAVCAVCLAFDSVKTADQMYTGTIQKMSALEVVIAKGVQAPETIPVNQIEIVRFDDDPTLLNTARTAVSAGRYEDALETLGRIDVGEVTRQEVKADIDFYKAYCASRIALAGGTKDAIMSAGSKMAAFVQGNSGNYHYLEACEIVGDLLVAAGLSDKAESYYGQLAKAPFPDYKMRAGVALGQAQLASGKAAEALKSFEAVLKFQDPGELADRQRMAATLGRARCLAEAGKADDAIKLVEAVIDKADPERHELLAQAYNALGIAYRKGDRTKDALLAFLHVDVLYFRSSSDHIEALRNLVELWNEVQKPERAAEATRILREQYNRSP
jgi:tetratricopeptide (TPR) repeat protein